MRKIRTLYITNLGLLDNLAQTQILPYLEGLSREGIAIHIFSFEKKEYLADAPKVDRLKRRLNDLKIGWEYLIYHRRWGNAVDLLGGFVRSYKIAKRRDVSIVHARSSIPILIGWIVAKLLKRKIIYDRRGTMVGDFVDDVNIKNIFSIRIFSIILDNIESFLIRHSDATIVLTKKAVDEFKKDPRLSGSSIITEAIPCCVNIAEFEKGNFQGDADLGLEGKFTICYIGSLGTCYLLEEMARFYKALKGLKDNTVFLIISHTGKRYIEDILKKEGLESMVDYIIIDSSPEKVPHYLSQSKCSIMFIKPVDCKIGSSPTKFGESLACGVPVIINRRIGDTEAIVRDRQVGVIVENLDMEAYKKSLSELFMLLAEDGLKERCYAAARELLSLDLGIERYMNVYKKVYAI
ncbi:MAG: hypothetical protein A2987_06120 [Omnitrophica bacterium RIFCSPLOWO2_01_FULL_45_10]|nr:MAG: hypothetical protein A2987_06120 [Omnitrophica bacterium RIFCSPLOWO2_01_FULL_45_10]